jgi:hypothetical protein
MTDGEESANGENFDTTILKSGIDERDPWTRAISRMWTAARHYRHEIVSTLSALIFGWYVLWQGTLGPPVTWPDSQTYESIAAHSIWSSAFWEGSKPPFTSLLWKFTGAPTSFDLVQSLIFAICWIYLARVVFTKLGKGWRGIAGTWLVLGFASTAPVLLWNRSVLSDSLAVSAVALLFAVMIRLLDGFTWLRFAALMGVATVNALNRYSQFATVAFLLLVALVMIVRRMRKGMPTKWLRYVAAGLVVIAGFTVFLESKASVTSLEITSIYQTRVFPFPNRVAWFTSHGLPDGSNIDAAAAAMQPSEGVGKVVQVNDPAVTNWVVAHGTFTYATWLLTHPVLIFTEPFARPEHALYSDGGVLQIYAASNRSDSPLTGVLYGTWTWLIPIFLVSLAAAGLRAFWKRRECRLMLIMAAAGLFTMLFAWHTDGHETDRHMLEGAIEFRLGILLCSLFALHSVSVALSTSIGSANQVRHSIQIRRSAGGMTNDNRSVRSVPESDDGNGTAALERQPPRD